MLNDWYTHEEHILTKKELPSIFIQVTQPYSPDLERPHFTPILTLVVFTWVIACIKTPFTFHCVVVSHN